MISLAPPAIIRPLPIPSKLLPIVYSLDILAFGTMLLSVSAK
jgi:hypothetical protein